MGHSRCRLCGMSCLNTSPAVRRRHAAAPARARFVALAAGSLLLGPVVEGCRSPVSSPADPGDQRPAASRLVRKAPTLAAQARLLVQRTTKLRELPLLRPVPIKILTRKQLLARIRERQQVLGVDRRPSHFTIGDGRASRCPPPQASEPGASLAALRRLGLIPHGVDVKKVQHAMLGGTVAGSFDPVDQTLNVAAEIPLDRQAPTLVHEICHALQRQHGLASRLPVSRDSDQQLAHLALVEGDCEGVSLEYLLAPSGRDLSSPNVSPAEVRRKMYPSAAQGKAMRDAPHYLKAMSAFPYIAGLRFIRSARRRYPWHRLTQRLYADPPESTSQLLHPELYWRRQRPLRLPTPPLESLERAGWCAIHRDTLGEFRLRLHLLLALDERAAIRAAAGWGADRLVAYRAASSRALPLVVSLSAWRTLADAQEFARAEQRVFARLARPVEARAAGAAHFRDADDQRWSIEQRGTRVLLLLGVPPKLHSALQRELWQRWR